MGRQRYPNAKSILITADCGGSNGYLFAPDLFGSMVIEMVGRRGGG
jgi:hypothetical protein